MREKFAHAGMVRVVCGKDRRGAAQCISGFRERRKVLVVCVKGLEGLGMGEGELMGGEANYVAIVGFMQGENPGGVGAVPDVEGVGNLGSMTE